MSNTISEFSPDDFVLSVAFHILRESTKDDDNIHARFILTSISKDENFFFEEGLPILESYPILRLSPVLELLRVGMQTFTPTFKQENGYDVLCQIVEMGQLPESQMSANTLLFMSQLTRQQL